MSDAELDRAKRVVAELDPRTRAAVNAVTRAAQLECLALVGDGMRVAFSKARTVPNVDTFAEAVESCLRAVQDKILAGE